MLLSLPPNGGLIPKLADNMLPPGGAVIATNVDLRSGLIKPISNIGAFVGRGNTSLYLDNTTGTWYTWPTDVDVVRSPVSQTRIIVTDGSNPTIQELHPTHTATYSLGIPAPTSVIVPSALPSSTPAFTIEWHWFYEETSGIRDNSDLTTLSVTTVTPNTTYTVHAIPARNTP